MIPYEPKNNHDREQTLSGLSWLPNDLVDSLFTVTCFLRKTFASEVSRIGLYGSWQRCAANAESDVDIVIFLDHEVAWFDAEKGIINRSASRKEERQWKRVELNANACRFDSRDYSIAVVTPAMLEYYGSHGPIHLQNWIYALRNCYTLWEAK